MMKRETENQSENNNSRENKKAKVDKESPSTSSSPLPLDLNNLGAGYNSGDQRVIRAIEIYETKLLPSIKEKESIFKSSNFLNIKGYGTDIPIN